MIFSAGLGTRFKPWTDTHPKALAIVNGKSLLQRNIEYLKQYGITDVVVNVHHFPEQIIEAIKINKGWGSNVVISDESDEVSIGRPRYGFRKYTGEVGWRQVSQKPAIGRKQINVKLLVGLIRMSIKHQRLAFLILYSKLSILVNLELVLFLFDRLNDCRSCIIF